ncbi:phage tail protein [Vibrio aestuarianus]|uniref:Phage tail protein n=2 Tax=Vibrio aestuarianus TaxID=28171 RepID=A0ABN8TU32_9VIBR|nr:phage tail protein [Vibrio aestuarianus]MDE1213769.1 phage tail protein [Vibrio aestuarianus]MDE1217226.1 phage tail protein [Vibrio aestuarianus]MDE1256966.1 phage tail protein [Vibrio aestuarianus]MDE1260767.1 phage tail protein [Vibrio aestuarianus]MDE1267563.1 phage tail protein [Vibrio aestuarianus]
MSEEYQAGYKFRELKAHIEQCVGKSIAKRLQTEMVELELVMGAKNQGHGFDLFTQIYEAEFYFDRFPFDEYKPATLFANFIAWLMDNDESREDKEIPDPEVSITVQSQNEAIIVVTVPFEEPVKIIEDENGDISWRGKMWRIEEYQIDVATKLKDVVIQ